MGAQKIEALKHAQEAFSLGQFRQAQELLEPIVRKDPDQYEAWALLAEVELGLNDPESSQICSENALGALQEAIEKSGLVSADDDAGKALEMLNGLWPMIVKTRKWNPRIEIPFWEIYGDSLVQLDQSIRAEICFGHVLRLRCRVMRDEAKGIGGVWQRLWATAFQQNRIATARRRIRNALRWFHKSGANKVTLGNAYGALAMLETEVANRQGAFEAFEAAMRFYDESEVDYLKAYILTKRASFYLLERDYAKAREDFEEGLSIARLKGGKVLFDVALDTAHYDHQIGERLGDHAHLQASWARLDEAESTGFTSAKARALRGIVAMQLGDLELARRHLLTATSIYRGFEKPDALSQAYVVWNLGGVLAAAGKASRALRLVRWAIKRFKGTYGLLHPSYLKLKITEAAMLNRLGDIEGARACLRIVIDSERDVLERFLRKGLPLELAAHQRISVEAFQAYAGLTLAAGGNETGDDILSALLATVGVARATLTATNRENKKDQIQQFPDLPNTVQFAAILRIYKPDVSPDEKKWSIEWKGASTICITRSNLYGTRIHQLGNADSFETKISRLRKQAKEGKALSVPTSLRLALSIDTVDHAPTDLIVLQSGMISSIPLSLCAPNRRIIEIEGNWGGLSSNRKIQSDKLVIASSDFIRSVAGKDSGEPHITKEIDAFGSNKTSRLLGDAATPEAVMNALSKRPRCVHIIAHGFGQIGRASMTAFNEAGLAFPVHGNPKLLLARDIASLDIDGVELVVLSACSTGVGQMVEGEGIASLASAFLQAGANAVLASLWPVGDKQASEIMSLFYSALENHPAAEALKYAQDKARTKGMLTRDWAGWQLYSSGIQNALVAFGHKEALNR